MESISCNLCGADDTADIAQRGRGGIALRNVICRRCTLVYVNPRPTSNELRDWYREGYHREYADIGVFVPATGVIAKPGTKEYEAERQKDMALRVDHVLERVPLHAGSRVLEIGSRTGAFLAQIRERSGAQVRGIEPSEEESRTAAARGIATFAGVLEDFETADRFDCIGLFHVLEHFADPLSALRKLRTLLAPEGALVIEVPNLYEPYGSLDDTFFQSAHLYSFSPQTLPWMLARSGFSMTSIVSATVMLVLARRAEPEEPELSAGQNWEWVLALLDEYRRWYPTSVRLRRDFNAEIERECRQFIGGPGDRTFKRNGFRQVVRAALAQRNWGVAVWWLEVLLKVDDSPDVLAALVHTNSLARDRRRAHSYLKQFRGKYPGHPDIPRLVGQARAIRG